MLLLFDNEAEAQLLINEMIRRFTQNMVHLPNSIRSANQFLEKHLRTMVHRSHYIGTILKLTGQRIADKPQLHLTWKSVKVI